MPGCLHTEKEVHIWISHILTFQVWNKKAVLWSPLAFLWVCGKGRGSYTDTWTKSGHANPNQKMIFFTTQDIFFSAVQHWVLASSPRIRALAFFSATTSLAPQCCPQGLWSTHFAKYFRSQDAPKNLTLGTYLKAMNWACWPVSPQSRRLKLSKFFLSLFLFLCWRKELKAAIYSLKVAWGAFSVTSNSCLARVHRAGQVSRKFTWKVAIFAIFILFLNINQSSGIVEK